MKIRIKNPKMMIPFCFIFGIVWAVMAARMTFSINEHNKLLKRCSETTVGTVIQVTEEKRVYRSRSMNSYYVYITDFTYEAGGIEQKGCEVIHERDRKAVGGEITVHYDPVTPELCCTDIGVTEYKASDAAIITALAAIFIGLGVFGLVMEMKRKRCGG